MGVGKTRLGICASQHIKEKLTDVSNEGDASRKFQVKDGVSRRGMCFKEIFGDIANIYIDFSISDSLYPHFESSSTVSRIIGLRLAARYFFGVSSSTLVREFQQTEMKHFEFSNVCSLISETFAKRHPGKKLLLTVQLDEFSYLDKAILIEIVKCFSKSMLEEHDLNICFVPILTGTDTKVGVDSISLSSIRSHQVLVKPLEEGDDVEAISAALKNTPFTTAFFKQNSLAAQALDSLGRVPRFLDFFARALSTQPSNPLWANNNQLPSKPEGVKAHLQKVLEKVRTEIADAYQLKKWNALLYGKDSTMAQKDHGVLQMLIWSLAAHPVRRDTKLNAVTVEQAQATGMLMLLPTRDPSEFTIHVPLILLRALNAQLEVVPDPCLDSLEMMDWKSFEKTMCVLRALRQNLLVRMQRSTASYRELYPHALGHPEDLDRVIPIQPLHHVPYNLKSTSPRYPIHKFPPDQIPVTDGHTINLAEVVIFTSLQEHLN